jgi:uncharacterized membrane-anchored protein YitT (DUF2179 family)
MKKTLLLLTDLLLIVVGNFIYAAGIAFFILPAGLITGGTTGISLFVNHMTGIPVSGFVLAFNLLMFLIGLALLGKKFAATTVISTFCYPAALAILERISAVYTPTDDVILCTIFGGLCIGIAIGIVIRAGASTGGMDIPPLVLNKYFRIPVSASIYVFDMLILLLQAFTSTGEQVLYGLLLVMVYTIVLDKCLMIGTSKMQVQVISNHSDEIRSSILGSIDRGVTMLHGRTGYLLNETELILTVVSTRELGRLEKLIHALDPDAFIIITKVNAVSGRGFSLEKKYRNSNAPSQ